MTKIDPKLMPKANTVICIGGSVFNAAYILKKDTNRNFEKLSKFKMSIHDLGSVISLLKTTPTDRKKNIRYGGNKTR